MSPLFNRNKKTTIAELEEYYANQQGNDSSAKAWAMAVLSLLLTIAVIVALFFAGRWLWNTISGDDDADQVATTSQQDGVIVREDGSLSGDLSLLDDDSSSSQTGGSVSVDSGSSSSEQSSSTSSGTVSDEAASTSQSNASSTSGSSSTDSDSSETDATSTLSNTIELPNTGAGAILVAPIVAGVAGYSAAITRKRR